MERETITYDFFVRTARAYCFTDDQLDFLWGIFAEWKPDPNDFKDFTPVSEKDSVEEGQFPLPCTCGIPNGICAANNHHPSGHSY